MTDRFPRSARAARSPQHAFTTSYRAATVRERLFQNLLAATVTGLALLCVASAPLFAQDKGGKASFAPSKTWAGQPDLQGIWQPAAHAVDNLEKGGFIKEPANHRVPYAAGGAAKRDQNVKNAKSADLVNKCYMPGVPRVMYMGYPFQIFQTDKYVAIVSEYAHVYRMIYLDGTGHLDFPDLWNGDSRGHWDGDTLVTDVTNFNDLTWLDKAGNHHSNQLHVTERFTRTGPNALLYEATVSDPKTLTKDVKVAVPMTQKTGPTARLMEYECQDLAFGQ